MSSWSVVVAAGFLATASAQDLFIPAENDTHEGFEIRRYTVDNFPGIVQGRRLLVDEKFAAVDQQRPEICDAGIVADTCRVLTGDERDTDVLDMGELHDILASDEESVEDFWEGLGLPEKPKCVDLCHAVVTWLEQHDHVVPPTSDVGCYHDYESGENKCDILMAPPDLGTDGDGNPHHGGDNPDFHGGEPGDVDKNPDQPPGDYDDVEDGDDDSDDADGGITYGGIGDVCVEVAHLFRIYPMIELDSQDGPDDGEEEGQVAQASLRGRMLASFPWIGGGGGGGGGGRWRTIVSKAEQLAIGYIATAVREFKKKKTKQHLQKWFGRLSFSDQRARRQILKVLNSVNQMLSHVDYVYPGPQCSPDTYAYVYPRAYTCRKHDTARRPCTKTDSGKFVFYMCRLTIERSPLSVQIETLTHEGSHHATAYTDDVCMDPGPSRGTCRSGTAYGRQACRYLAQTQRQKALINADNYCYYIQDITDVSR